LWVQTVARKILADESMETSWELEALPSSPRSAASRLTKADVSESFS
jgi:hypothetical protein